MRGSRTAAADIFVDVQHFPRRGPGLGLRGMRCVALLPKELRRPQEGPRPELPAHLATPRTTTMDHEHPKRHAPCAPGTAQTPQKSFSHTHTVSAKWQMRCTRPTQFFLSLFFFFKSCALTTFAHWLSLSGRSRCDLIHRPNMCQIMVSEVGRTTSGSSSFAVGSGQSFPSGPGASRWCVT